jgi:hypothetical protein
MKSETSKVAIKPPVVNTPGAFVLMSGMIIKRIFPLLDLFPKV